MPEMFAEPSEPLRNVLFANTLRETVSFVLMRKDELTASFASISAPDGNRSREVPNKLAGHRLAGWLPRYYSVNRRTFLVLW